MYRADIDGLRAVAVISVILYHLGVSGFSGGFVGVDVFFVISGFLITRLILVDLQEGKFSFVEFYGRRARRLFPAFFFMIIVSSVVAYLIFTPEHLARFSGAVVYALGSISNFYFFGESGYFDAGANFKPLLHTWTLGVEEQFYFIWPLALYIIVKKAHKWMAPFLIVLAGLISLYFSELLLVSSPDAVFYLVPFRVTEFAIGSVLVWFIGFQPNNKIVIETIPLIGFLMIAYSIYSYSNEILFPGLNALLPCLGAAMIIYSANSKILEKSLGNSLVVRIGLISYSLYLVHWPIIVFYKYYKFDTVDYLTIFETVSLIIVTFVIAILMYTYIEKPFRNKSYKGERVSVPAFGFICAILSLLLIIPAASSWATGGWVWRYVDLSESARNELKIKNDDFRLYAYKKIIELDKQSFTNNSKKKVLVVGDSQAGDFINMIYENGYHNSIDLSAIVIGAKCQPVFLDSKKEKNFIKEKYKKTCKVQRNKYIESEKLDQADVAILVANWRKWGVDELDNTIDALKRKGIKEIYVVGPKAQGESGQTLLARYRKTEGIEAFSAERMHHASHSMNNVLKINENYTYIDLLKYICPNKKTCQVLTPDDKVIFYDISHVTSQGAKYLGRLLYKSGELSFIK